MANKNVENNYITLHHPPHEVIWEMNGKESREYYDWYMSKIPERVKYLIKVCSEELQISREYLDMSPESLKYIWKWFLSIMKVRKTPIVRLQEIYRKFVITINKEKEFERNKRMELSSKTRDILQDIAMYFGEVIVKNNPKIYWSYYGEQWEDVYNNYPVLKGFIYSTELEGTHRIVIPPQIYVDGEAAKVLNGEIQSEEDLIELYKLLCEHIPQ